MKPDEKQPELIRYILERMHKTPLKVLLDWKEKKEYRKHIYNSYKEYSNKMTVKEIKSYQLLADVLNYQFEKNWNKCGRML